MRTAVSFAIALSIGSVALAARADDDVAPPPARKLVLRPLAETADDGATKEEAPRKHAEERPFVYAMDPTTASKGDTSVEYSLGLASGASADRPLPAGLGYDGAVHALTVGYGVTSRIEPFVSARILQSTVPNGHEAGGGVAGVRVQLTSPESPFRLTLAGAAFRDFSPSFGAWTRVAASYDVGRVRFVGNVHAERAFTAGRDDVDLLVFGGVSYRALDTLRVGAEYVGQDLEESGAAAEGGPRHYVGPTLALDLDGISLVGGPAFGLVRGSADVLGRVALAASFLGVWEFTGRREGAKGS